MYLDEEDYNRAAQDHSHKADYEFCYLCGVERDIFELEIIDEEYICHECVDACEDYGNDIHTYVQKKKGISKQLIINLKHK